MEGSNRNYDASIIGFKKQNASDSADRGKRLFLAFAAFGKRCEADHWELRHYVLEGCRRGSFGTFICFAPVPVENHRSHRRVRRSSRSSRSLSDRQRAGVALPDLLRKLRCASLQQFYFFYTCDIVTPAEYSVCQQTDQKTPVEDLTKSPKNCSLVGKRQRVLVTFDLVSRVSAVQDSNNIERLGCACPATEPRC